MKSTFTPQRKSEIDIFVSRREHIKGIFHLKTFFALNLFKYPPISRLNIIQNVRFKAKVNGALKAYISFIEKQGMIWHRYKNWKLQIPDYLRWFSVCSGSECYVFLWLCEDSVLCFCGFVCLCLCRECSDTTMFSRGSVSRLINFLSQQERNKMDNSFALLTLTTLDI